MAHFSEPYMEFGAGSGDLPTYEPTLTSHTLPPPQTPPPPTPSPSPSTRVLGHAPTSAFTLTLALAVTFSQNALNDFTLGRGPAPKGAKPKLASTLRRR